jgi:hypothetical protein
MHITRVKMPNGQWHGNDVKVGRTTKARFMTGGSQCQNMSHPDFKFSVLAMLVYTNNISRELVNTQI